jgi:ribosomal protein S18 acetylase RimI-like enzyme
MRAREEAMPNIRYLDSADTLTADHLRGGFFAGWPNPPSPEAHLRLLHGSDVVVLAVDTATDTVVGYITAITDGVLAAYIPHLEVLPEFQNQGIGGELVRRMLARLRDFYMIDLLCDPDLQPYYARFGMRPATGMFTRNYERQAGTTTEG